MVLLTFGDKGNQNGSIVKSEGDSNEIMFIDLQYKASAASKLPFRPEVNFNHRCEL